MHQKIKKTISWIIGFPAGLIAVSEVNDLAYWWVQFLAVGILILVLLWNHAFGQEQYQPKLNRRRSF